MVQPMGSELYFERDKIVVGSRSSALAKAQSELLCEYLRLQLPRTAVSLVTSLSSGDMKRDSGKDIARDKRDWIFELEQAVLAGEIDIALHSGKDVPVDIHPSTTVVPVLERAHAYDVCIVSTKYTQTSHSLSSLPPNASIGTASKRRAAQLRRIRPDCSVRELRGNVPTRLQRLESGDEYDAIILAAAGISRLKISSPGMFVIGVEEMLPAVNQGILLAQVRNDDHELLGLLSSSSSKELARVSSLERRVVQGLGADCHSALGVMATVERDSAITLKAEVLSELGDISIKVEQRGCDDDELVSRVLQSLFDQGARELLSNS